MTVLASFTIGEFDFQIQVNPANVAALMQRDVLYKTKHSDYQFLRSFYFDDIAQQKIDEFCTRFAEDETCRNLSLARKTDWAQCNDLFLRNCFNPYFQENPVLEQSGSLVAAYQFFKEHTATIIARDEYQRLYQRDSAIIPDAYLPDPEITDIVSEFNQIDGVTTLASCQGVSGTVSYQNYEILTVSPHARYAYLWFAKITPAVANNLKQAPFKHAIFTDNVYPALQSTGDNSAFLAEVRAYLNQSTI